MVIQRKRIGALHGVLEQGGRIPFDQNSLELDMCRALRVLFELNEHQRSSSALVSWEAVTNNFVYVVLFESTQSASDA